METKNIIRKFKWFWAWQDIKREEWLSQMSSAGWHLNGISKLGLFFNFIKGEPRDFTYQLDYRVEKETDTKEYLEFIQDADWEHVVSYGGWHYFRRPTSGDATDEIFTDGESKISKYKRLIGALVVIYPGYFVIFLANLDKYPGWFATILVSVFGFLTFYVSISMIGLMTRIKELKSQE